MLAAFERLGVRYVLVGSMAMAAHGVARATRTSTSSCRRTRITYDDIDGMLDRLRKHGAQLVCIDAVQCEDAYRLCYVRGPEGILIGLAQQLHRAQNRAGSR